MANIEHLESTPHRRGIQTLKPLSQPLIQESTPHRRGIRYVGTTVLSGCIESTPHRRGILAEEACLYAVLRGINPA